ncbi:MAG: site-2 protease family protein [Desulfobacteraceae bacterium]|nr:site-2 protease family protein [Desulfobacteraceae bacterium]
MNINHLLQQLVITAPPFLFALTVHEFAHGYVAYKLGDPTAARLGRLSLNPMKHLDPLGVLAFFLTKIGWAKPVPIDARYFRNPGRDMLLVALAGPGINLALAVASTLSAKVIIFASAGLPAFLVLPLLQMTVASIWINLMLAVFNLVPIPPLDGSRVLSSLLPSHMARSYARLEPYGFIIVLILFYTGLLPRLIMPIVSFAQNLIMG